MKERVGGVTTDKEQIERATRAFIDSSFKKLRNAEAAFELLQNFKSIKSEGAINKQMMDKFNDILEQFSREIDVTRDIFEANKATPPVTRNQPPVAGAINWSRSLFQRIRKTYNTLAYSEDEQVRGWVPYKFSSRWPRVTPLILTSAGHFL